MLANKCLNATQMGMQFPALFLRQDEAQNVVLTPQVLFNGKHMHSLICPNQGFFLLKVGRNMDAREILLVGMGTKRVTN